MKGGRESGKGLASERPGAASVGGKHKLSPVGLVSTPIITSGIRWARVGGAAPAVYASLFRLSEWLEDLMRQRRDQDSGI